MPSFNGPFSQQLVFVGDRPVASPMLSAPILLCTGDIYRAGEAKAGEPVLNTADDLYVAN